MKLDRIDYKILWNLDYDARIPLSGLAKEVGISKQNLNYRMKRLLEEGIISGSMVVVDIDKLGYSTYRVFARYRGISAEREKKVVDYLKKDENVLWLASVSGAWDIEIVFTARNPIHFNNIFKKMRGEIGNNFSKYTFSVSEVNYHFKRDYLLGMERDLFNPIYYGFEPESEKIGKLDVRILSELSKDCRQSNSELGEKIGVSYHTVKEHISDLERRKIIQSYRIQIDLNKLERAYYKILLTLNNPSKEDEKKMYGFCSNNNLVVYLVEALGNWNMDIEMEVQNQGSVTEFLRELRSAFPDKITDYDILLVTKEHKINYFPMGMGLQG